MYTYPGTGGPYCNICSKAEENMIETSWASGNHHYCKTCWPKYRDTYESEEGREAWVRAGDYYARRCGGRYRSLRRSCWDFPPA
jgi:hypothetical protein